MRRSLLRRVGGQIPAASRRVRGSSKLEHSKAAFGGVIATGPLRPVSREPHRSAPACRSPDAAQLAAPGWRPDPGGKPPGPGLQQAGALQGRLRRRHRDRALAAGVARAPPECSGLPEPRCGAACCAGLAARSRRQAAGSGAPASWSTPRPPSAASSRQGPCSRPSPPSPAPAAPGFAGFQPARPHRSRPRRPARPSQPPRPPPLRPLGRRHPPRRQHRPPLGPRGRRRALSQNDRSTSALTAPGQVLALHTVP